MNKTMSYIFIIILSTFNLNIATEQTLSDSFIDDKDLKILRRKCFNLYNELWLIEKIYLKNKRVSDINAVREDFIQKKATEKKELIQNFEKMPLFMQAGICETLTPGNNGPLSLDDYIEKN